MCKHQHWMANSNKMANCRGWNYVASAYESCATTFPPCVKYAVAYRYVSIWISHPFIRGADGRLAKRGFLPFSSLSRQVNQKLNILNFGGFRLAITRNRHSASVSNLAFIWPTKKDTQKSNTKWQPKSKLETEPQTVTVTCAWRIVFRQLYRWLIRKHDLPMLAASIQKQDLIWTTIFFACWSSCY